MFFDKTFCVNRGACWNETRTKLTYFLVDMYTCWIMHKSKKVNNTHDSSGRSVYIKASRGWFFK